MLLRAVQITKDYTKGKGKPAVNDCSFEIAEGESVGLFGNSGSGKSTIGMMTAGLLLPDSGKLFYLENEITGQFKGKVRREIQILFQHPETSFNPMLPLISSLSEPYTIYGQKFLTDRLIDHLQQYGLREEHIYRRPSELSGGELQRAALARIMVMCPKLIILDEPTSMLDVITQAQMVRLLKENQKRENTSYLFITHNRSLCEQFCDRIYEIENGNVRTDHFNRRRTSE